jgi:hypothetical protein
MLLLGDAHGGGDRCFQVLADKVHQAAIKEDARTEKTLTAPIWALMHGHAMFAMDDSFANMKFKPRGDILVHDTFKLLIETPTLGSD